LTDFTGWRRIGGVPLPTFTVPATGERIAVNALLVQSVAPSGEGTILTFANGDEMLVYEHFDLVIGVLRGA
jgi:hypothetical protein